MNIDLTDESFISDDLKAKLFQEAKNELGELPFDECYGFVPLLVLGGGEKVENLRKVNTKIHINLITKVAGTVE